jgi:hypothetical protein
MTASCGHIESSIIAGQLFPAPKMNVGASRCMKITGLWRNGGDCGGKEAISPICQNYAMCSNDFLI